MTGSPLRKLSPKNGLDDSSLLRTLIDSLPEQIYVKDTEGRYILSNLAHVRALGSPSPEETAGKSDSDFYPKELAERYRSDEQEVLRSGRPLVDREEPGVDGKGNERWHSITKVPMRDGSGEIVGIVGIIRDVTERKEAERALRESEDRFRNLSDATFEGIAIIEDGEVLETNRAFAEMYGYELSEVRGMSALEFHVPEVRGEVWRKISSGCSEPYESVGLQKDGTAFDVEIQEKTTWHGGRHFRVTAVRDITERKQAEEKLRQGEERFRSLIQNASDVIVTVP